MNTENKFNKTTIQWIIILFFMFGFGFLPPVGQITPAGMRALGIFIGAVYGWTVIGILKPTILAITSFILLVGELNSCKVALVLLWLECC